MGKPIGAPSGRHGIDVYLDRIEIYEDGYVVGEVNRIPEQLARTRASVDRNGYVRFDRDLFLVGDPRVGFELISTRHYDGFILNSYRRSHGIRVGVLDLRRERVVGVRQSRFLDPRRFGGYVPIHLLPEDTGWMIDYAGCASDDTVRTGTNPDEWFETRPAPFGTYTGRLETSVNGARPASMTRRHSSYEPHRCLGRIDAPASSSSACGDSTWHRLPNRPILR